MPGNPTQRPLRRIVTIVVAVLVIPVVVHAAQIAWVFLAPPVEYYLHASKFDSAAWKARSMDAEVMWPTRLRTVDDLLERRALNGLARARVEELLVRPTTLRISAIGISSNN